MAVAALERHVCNNGFGEFLINPAREFAPIVVDALLRIGCPKTAEITQQALEIVKSAPITDQEIEEETWPSNEERFRALYECDGLYLEQTENLRERLFAFIKANRAGIAF